MVLKTKSFKSACSCYPTIKRNSTADIGDFIIAEMMLGTARGAIPFFPIRKFFAYAPARIALAIENLYLQRGMPRW